MDAIRRLLGRKRKPEKPVNLDAPDLLVDFTNMNVSEKPKTFLGQKYHDRISMPRNDRIVISNPPTIP